MKGLLYKDFLNIKSQLIYYAAAVLVFIAVSYFQKNNQSFGSPIRGILGDALNPALISGNFDLIVSNPPYLTRSEMDALQPEVTREPAMALYGQDDGLYFYKEFCKIYCKREFLSEIYRRFWREFQKLLRQPVALW